MELNDEKLNKLITEIEKVRRRKIVNFSDNDNIQYLDPFDNLGKIKIPNNHLVLGRRGSGKTTLLLCTIKEDKSNLIFPVDCQVYRNTAGDKIILDALIRILNHILEELPKIEVYIKAKSDFEKSNKGILNWGKNLFRTKTEITLFEEFLTFSLSLKNLIHCLDSYQELPDEEFEISISEGTKQNSKSDYSTDSELKAISKLKSAGKLKGTFASVEADLEIAASIKKQIKNQISHENSKESKIAYKKTISKSTKLNELRITVADFFSEFSRLTKQKVILYLDDFYLIDLNKQPRVIQYLHDIYKNSQFNAFCFKLCSIPNRTRLNEEGKVDFSIKDDFSPIRLDKELYDFINLKDFLLRVTSNLNPDLSISSNDISSLFNNDDVLNYTAVATGGVPRDFLVTLSELIKIARTDQSSSIKKEHLYSAVADLKLDKEQNIEVESDMSPEILRNALVIIEEQIIRDLNTNVVLYPTKLVKDHEHLLKNLVNLRYLHIISENVTSENVKKETFTAYLVDMTFYAKGKKLKPGFKFRPFWEQDEKHRLTHLRSAPIWNFNLDEITVPNKRS